MRLNPWRWLWGLVPIAMLCWIALLSERPRIESDLKGRADAAMKAAGFTWAKPVFIGRDATLTGLASEESEPGDAARRVLSNWGVRMVDNRSDLLEKADVYRWSAFERDNKIRISGVVPNEAVRKSVLDLAKSAFPRRDIEDGMKLARGAPPRDTWLSGVGFGLKQLALLRNGTVELEGTSLSIAGPADDSVKFKTVRSAISTGMPKGIQLKSDRVTPPVVTPYTWSARLDGNRMSLEGHVPSDQVRQQISAAARDSLPRGNVVDRSELALGAPDGFGAAAVAVVRGLGNLEAGAADLRAGQINIAGMATNDVQADNVRRTLRERMPASIRLTEAIKFKAPAVPVFDPFRTMVDATPGAVILSGHVPSDSAKAAMTEAARARFSGRRVDNQLIVGNGSAPGWQSCMQAGIAGLGRLGAGKATLTNRTLEVVGETTDEQLHGALQRDIRQAAGTSCDVDADVTLRDLPEPNLNWRAQADSRQVEMEGEVPDAASKRALAEHAARLFPGRALVDRTRVANIAPRRWPEVAELALRHLARLRSGNAELRGQQLTITGEAAERATAASINEQLSGRMARGYAGQGSLSVRSDAEIAADDARGRAEADTRRRGEEQAALDSRRRTEADAKRRAEQASAEAAGRAATDRCQVELRRVSRGGLIQFERASADINPKSHATLDELLRAVRACPIVVVEIEGHTDAEGAPDRNQRLSERRANAVRQYLIEAGADGNRLQAIGYGQDKPIAPNDTAEDRARNRRIEFTVKSN